MTLSLKDMPDFFFTQSFGRHLPTQRSVGSLAACVRFPIAKLSKPATKNQIAWPNGHCPNGLSVWQIKGPPTGAVKFEQTPIVPCPEPSLGRLGERPILILAAVIIGRKVAYARRLLGLSPHGQQADEQEKNIFEERLHPANLSHSLQTLLYDQFPGIYLPFRQVFNWVWKTIYRPGNPLR